MNRPEPIELENNLGPDAVTGEINRVPWMAYDVDETTDSDDFESHEKKNPEPLYNVIKNGKEQKWISVKDAMPANDDDVLIWNGAYCDIGNAYDGEDGREFFVDSPESREVTHWMPLPKPPKEEK